MSSVRALGARPRMLLAEQCWAEGNKSTSYRRVSREGRSEPHMSFKVSPSSPAKQRSTAGLRVLQDNAGPKPRQGSCSPMLSPVQGHRMRVWGEPAPGNVRGEMSKRWSWKLFKLCSTAPDILLTVKYHEGSGFHRAKSEKLGEGEREKGKIAEGPPKCSKGCPRRGFLSDKPNKRNSVNCYLNCLSQRELLASSWPCSSRAHGSKWRRSGAHDRSDEAESRRLCACAGRECCSLGARGRDAIGVAEETRGCRPSSFDFA